MASPGPRLFQEGRVGGAQRDVEARRKVQVGRLGDHDGIAVEEDEDRFIEYPLGVGTDENLVAHPVAVEINVERLVDEDDAEFRSAGRPSRALTSLPLRRLECVDRGVAIRPAEPPDRAAEEDRLVFELPGFDADQEGEGVAQESRSGTDASSLQVGRLWA